MKNAAIITGAAQGIGLALAAGFQERGYEVIGIDSQEAASKIDGVVYYKADISSQEEIAAVFKQLNLQRPSILINNAAISFFKKNIYEMSVDDFKRVIEVNLIGTFNVIHHFLNNFKGSWGRIINLSSTRSEQNEAGWDAYGASKGGIRGLTQSLAISLAGTGLTVNGISPGWIQTTNYEQLSDSDHKQHPSGRVGKSSDILNLALFLADECNSFINGEVIKVDGGMTKKMIYNESF